MPKPRLLLYLLLAFPLLAAAPASAFAQDDDDDDEPGAEDGDDEPEPDESDDDEGDDDDESEPDEPAARPSRTERKSKRPAREVVKGAYAKVNMGLGIALPPFKAYTSSTSTQVDFSFGVDAIDRLAFTLTIEGSFFNMISNANGPIRNADGTFTQSVVQGDYNLIGGTAAVRFGPNFGGKRVKRLHLAIQVGGGVGYSPKLVNDTSQLFSANGLVLLQGGPVGLITPGVGLEYYTRLSHFSLGLDVDFNVVVGRAGVVPMWVTPSLFIKYTF
jgi:hypothetical protein